MHHNRKNIRFKFKWFESRKALLIVGKNAAGKTTIIKKMMKNYKHIIFEYETKVFIIKCIGKRSEAFECIQYTTIDKKLLKKQQKYLINESKKEHYGDERNAMFASILKNSTLELKRIK